MEDLTGNMDPKIGFRLIVVQTELERVKFLIRSLVRARIAKVGKVMLCCVGCACIRLMVAFSQVLRVWGLGVHLHWLR